MTEPLSSISTAEIDAGVERQHERALARYEAEVDRRDREYAAWERDADELAWRYTDDEPYFLVDGIEERC